MSRLFEPLTLRGLTFPNRVWVAPMCQYSASTKGVVGDWHLVHLGSYATGRAGLIVAEATAVSPEGRISTRCPGIWDDEQVAAWRRVTDFVHAQGGIIALQLAHAGRKGSFHGDTFAHATPEEGGWTTVAPSAVAFEDYPTPVALDHDDIDRIVVAFADATTRALAAGFDFIEIHAAHGYLLHEFLSPLSNHRTDEYGGSFENRTRVVRRVVEAVRGRLPDDRPLFIRFSSTDWVDNGWDLEQTVTLSAQLKDLGVDLVDASSGGNLNTKIPVAPGYQIPFAEAIRATGVATSAVGLITEPEQAQAVLDEGHADAVMLARAFLRDPHWAMNAAERLGCVIPWNTQYERGRTVR